jgi:hypothetical protein
VSKTDATQLGMTNQWLKEQGLLSIKDLWVNMYYPGYGPVTSRNALCGPACRVLWGGAEKNCPLRLSKNPFSNFLSLVQNYFKKF